MHHDIHPLEPFSNANPLIGLVTHDGVYQLCVVMGMVGAAAWLLTKWLKRNGIGEKEIGSGYR
jgi:flagellar biogenesis protein FliO